MQTHKIEAKYTGCPRSRTPYRVTIILS